MQVTILYGSSTGATQNVAEMIAQNLEAESTLIDVANANISNLQSAQNIILGTSTWGEGNLQDDWESFLPQLKEVNWEGKKVALFGLGDQETYYDSFADGLGILFETLKEQGAQIIGDGQDVDEYDFGESRAVVNGKFAGLVIDEENQSDLSEQRIKEWSQALQTQF